MSAMEVIVWLIILVGLLAALGVCIDSLCSDSPPLDEEEMKYQKWKEWRDKIEQERQFEQRYQKEKKGD